MTYFNIVAETTQDTVVASYEPLKERSEAYQSEAQLEAQRLCGDPRYSAGASCGRFECRRHRES